MYQTNQLILNSDGKLEDMSLRSEYSFPSQPVKRPYEKPYINKEKTMNFPLEIINSLGERIVCRQCSSCHGCR